MACSLEDISQLSQTELQKELRAHGKPHPKTRINTLTRKQATNNERILELKQHYILNHLHSG